MWGDDPNKKKGSGGLFGDKKSNGWGDELYQQDLNVDLDKRSFDDQIAKPALDNESGQPSHYGNFQEDKPYHFSKTRFWVTFITIIVLVQVITIFYQYKRFESQNASIGMMMDEEDEETVQKQVEFLQLKKKISKMREERQVTQFHYDKLRREIDDESVGIEEESAGQRIEEEPQDMDEEGMRDSGEITRVTLKQQELRLLDEKLRNLDQSIQALSGRRDELERQLKEQEREHWKSH